MGKLLDGKEASEHWLTELKEEIASLSKKPSLVLIRVGDDAASGIYVKSKIKACEKVGMHSEVFHYPSSISQNEIESKISALNSDDSITGIIIQLPLPQHLNVHKLQELINPLKDVDGFCDENQRLLEKGNPRLIAATPAGIFYLLNYYGLDVRGKNCVVMGRSKIVGTPLAHLLRFNGADVHVVHSKTDDPIKIIRLADFLFVAIGKPKYVKANMVKDGVVVVDVGINRLEDRKPSGDMSADDSLPPKSKLVGDVDFDKVKEKASYITPVPGGVGRMTVASLIANTLLAHKLQEKG